MQNQGQAAAAPFGQQQPPQATSTAMMQQSTSHFATVPGQQAQQGPVQQSVTMPLQHHQQQSQQQQQQAPQQLFPHQGLNGGWQSDKDYQERRKMIAKIVYLLQQRKPHAPQEWLKKLPQMAKRLEESLYRSAKSFEEYNDANTLKNRLHQLSVNIVLNRKRMQQQGTSQQQQPPQQQQQIPQEQKNMTSVADQKIIPLEEGWDAIKTKGINKLEDMLNSGKRLVVTELYSPREYVEIYAYCHDMCTQRSPYNWSRELYQRHGEAMEQYLITHVLPALRVKTGPGGTVLLTEVLYRWNNHRTMNKVMRKLFTYLDRWYVKHHSLPTLLQAGVRCFRTVIYDEMETDMTAAVLDLVNNEREGKVIDKTLVKSIVNLYESMGMGLLDVYQEDLEEPLLSSTREYYAKKREDWMNDSTLSVLDYKNKVEEALRDERKRVADYLDPSSEVKITKVVEEELVDKAKSMLAEKESSSGCAVIKNNKSDELYLQKVYWRCLRRENGLVPIVGMVHDLMIHTGTNVMTRCQAGSNGYRDDEKDNDKRKCCCHALYHFIKRYVSRNKDCCEKSVV